MSPPRIPHRPYIAAGTSLPEMTLRAVLVGTVLGIIFGASSLYLVLKVGLTVSASIPVAVISITLFRLLSRLGVRDASILENNIVQTTGSAGESIAFGVGVTMPAILILGFDLELTRVLLVAVLGGLLGILMMIPLRHALIVNQHGILKYPEGTACAAVLKAGASVESRAAADPLAEGTAGQAISARTIFAGFGIGLIYKTLNVALKGWRDAPGYVFGAPLKGGSIATDVSPELLGVGYIIGPRISSMMFAGGVMAYLLLIPLIKYFGAQIGGLVPPGTLPIAEMTPSEVRGAYILYIGAGAVAAGGIVSLIRALPLIASSIHRGFGGFAVARQSEVGKDRTDQDIPIKLVGIGIILLLTIILLSPSLHMNLLGALLILVLGALFVTVSSRLTGEIGSTSNPISGMTIAALMLTCLVFLIVGWTGDTWYVTALSVGGIVCVACSNGGTISQDLKTGYLVGATPRLQQVSILVGAFVSALCMGPILLQLNESATVYVPIAQVAPQGLKTDVQALGGQREALRGVQAADDARTYRVWQKTSLEGGPAGKYLVDEAGTAVWLVDPGINGTHDTRPDGTSVRKFDAPKATLVSYIIKGILDRELPWELVIFGATISLILELSGVPSLAFAVGVYLPISSSTPLFVGGLIRWLADKRAAAQPASQGLTGAEFVAMTDRGPGVLLASGYIAGGAIAGIV
ncbi:MAG: oligopeptide transporter, OPT family, partial [Gammaproteobacteria bacterium]|nr:oligopeptide transporter, OPT family [Gammaproteobacteria bacterium]